MIPQLMIRRSELHVELQSMDMKILSARTELEALATRKLLLLGAFQQLEEVLKVLETNGNIPVQTPEVPAIPGA